MIIGTLPVVIAVSSNLRDHARDGRLAWRRLAPSLGLIAGGIALVNQVEIDRLRSDPRADLDAYALGALLAVGAVACWTWYPLRNADWLRAGGSGEGRSPAHLGDRPGPGHLAAGRGWLPGLLGVERGQWPGSCDALRADAWTLRRPDARHRPAGFLARHAVLERGQPALADDTGRATHRLRDAGGAGLCVRAAWPMAEPGHGGGDRPAGGRRAGALRSPPQPAAQNRAPVPGPRQP